MSNDFVNLNVKGAVVSKTSDVENEESQGRKGREVSRSTMTKADIVEKVYSKIGFSKKEASELVEMVFSNLKEVLHNGDKVKISGFGNFVVREKNERVGRNPQTGEQIKISARRVLTFRPSQVLKAMLNGEDVTGLKDED